MKNLLRHGLAKKAILFAFVVGLVSPSAFAYTDVAPINLGGDVSRVSQQNPVDLGSVSKTVDLGASTSLVAAAPQVVGLGVASSTGSASVYFHLSEAAKTTVWIKDSSDVIVKTLLFDTDLVANQTYQYTWNGTDNSNAQVASGNYQAVVVAHNTADTAVQRYGFSYTSNGGGQNTVAPVVSVSLGSSTFDPTKGETTTVNYSVSQPATVGVVVSYNGATVKVLKPQATQSAGSYTLTWDGRNDSGTIVNPGSYSVTVSASNSAGSDSKTGSVSVVNGGTNVNAPVLSNVYASPNPFNPSNENTRINFTLDKTATVSLVIVDGGSTVRNLLSNTSLNAGTYVYEWNGRDSSGNTLSSKTYTATVSASNSAGSDSKSTSVQISTSGGNNTCDLVTSHYADPSSFSPNNEDTRIYFNLNRSATVTVRITRNGDSILTLISNQSFSSGGNSTYWNGRNNSGSFVSNGTYTYEIRSSASGCSDDVETGTIYVTDSSGTGNYVSDWASTNENLITNLSVNPEIFDPTDSERTDVSFYLRNNAKVRVDILDGNRVVKTIRNSQNDKQSSGTYTYSWDGRDYNGNRVNDNVFQVRAMADDGYQSDTDRADVEVDTDGIIIGFPTSSRCAGFRDVSINSPFCKAIELMSKKKIFEGYSDGTFRPYEKINRAETAKVVVLALKYDVPTSGYFGRQYSDTSANAWYAPYLEVAKKNDIATGYPDGSFRPANTINRVELLRIFLEANNVGLSSCSPAPFEDTPITSDTNWYMKYACYAKNNGLMNSDTTNRLYPAEAMTRGDVADLFYDFEVKGLYDNYKTNDSYNYRYCNSNDYNCINNRDYNYDSNYNYNYNYNNSYSCDRYDYDCQNNYNYNNNYNNNYYYNNNNNYSNNDGYYVYRNGRYEWVSY